MLKAAIFFYFLQYWNSWRWRVDLSETCRALYQHKFDKLVRLFGFRSKNKKKWWLFFGSPSKNDALFIASKLRPSARIFARLSATLWRRIGREGISPHILKLRSRWRAGVSFPLRPVLTPGIVFLVSIFIGENNFTFLLLQLLATDWTVRVWNPGLSEIFRTRPDWPWGPPSPLHEGHRVSFPGLKPPAGAFVDHLPSVKCRG